MKTRKLTHTTITTVAVLGTTATEGRRGGEADACPRRGHALEPPPPPRLLRLTPENRKTCEESLSTGSEPRASHFLPRWCFRPSRVAQNHRARPAEAARTRCWAPRTTYPPHRPDPDDPASAHSPTCERVGAGQVVTREVDEGMVLRVDELGLRGHVAGVLHGAGRVDDVHLQHRHTQRPERGPGAGERFPSSRD